MKNQLSRIALSILSIVYSSLNVFAGPADHGRDYSVEGGSSSPTPILMIVGGIILFIVSLMLIGGGENKDGTSNNKGCGIASIIIAILIIIFGISQCVG